MCIKSQSQAGTVVTTFNPSEAETGRHLWEFKTTVVHIVSSRSAGATQQDQTLIITVLVSAPK